MPEGHLGFMIVDIGKSNAILALIRRHLWYVGLCSISKTGFIWWQKLSVIFVTLEHSDHVG